MIWLFLLTAAISCPALPTDGLNGQITYSVDTPPPYNFGTIATYLCDTSYGVTGDSILTCGVGSGTTGTWGSSTTTCERELKCMFVAVFNIYNCLITGITCQSLAPIMNGMISYLPMTTPYLFGSAAQYTCNDGFYIQGNDVRTCASDGSSSTGVWSDTSPVCSGKSHIFNFWFMDLFWFLIYVWELYSISSYLSVTNFAGTNVCNFCDLLQNCKY